MSDSSPPPIETPPPPSPPRKEFNGWMVLAGFGVYPLLIAIFFIPSRGPAFIDPLVIVQLGMFVLPIVAFFMVFFRRTRAIAIGLLIGAALCWSVFLAICGPFLFGGLKM